MSLIVLSELDTDHGLVSFASEVFRSSLHQSDLMIAVGKVPFKIDTGGEVEKERLDLIH